MSCIITYKGNQYSEQEFKKYFNSNTSKFIKEIANSKNVIDSFKNKIDAINFVFQQAPELESIGTKTQYLKYLSTIFPNSKVKDIVYHGTNNPNFSGFGSDFSRAIHFGTLQAAKDRRLHTDFEFKRNAKFIPVILNIKNPLKTEVDFNFEGEGLEFVDDPDFDFTKEQGHRLLITYLHNKGYNVYHPEGGVYRDGEILNNAGLDSVIYKNEREDKGNYSYAVFEPEQIHILGNKQDIENFKKFVEQPINKEIKPNEVKGENITSKGSEFAKKLTNVGNSVGITYKGKEYLNSEHAYQTWKSGEFNQAGYNLKGGKVRGGKIGDTFSIMTDILTEKLKQHPDLVQGITERGGLEYLQKSTHNVIGDKFWESTGQNKFIEALTQAYKNVNQPTEIKPKIDSSKKIENLKRGDIINFQQQEFLVERVKNEGIDVRDVNTGDVDFISTEDYINETQEQPIVEETKENWEDSDNECGI